MTNITQPEALVAGVERVHNFRGQVNMFVCLVLSVVSTTENIIKAVRKDEERFVFTIQFSKTPKIRESEKAFLKRE